MATGKRWNITAWIPHPSKIRESKVKTTACHMCAIKGAMAWAQAINHRRMEGDPPAQWTVEQLRGHLNDWEVVYHSGMTVEQLFGHHAHG